MTSTEVLTGEMNRPRIVTIPNRIKGKPEAIPR